MHWYGGSIAEAVNLSKQKNAIFVVFVEGDNDLSTEMAATIDDAVVLTRLSDQGNFLAVKLKSGSANYLHFAQIYQFVPVPSLFFIGRNGTPLDVVCAGVQPSNLATRIDRILEEHSKDKQPSVSSSLAGQPSTSSTTIAQSPTTQPPTSQLPTSQPPTSQLPTSQPPTSEPPTTQPPTSEPPTTQPPTTQLPTTQLPTTQLPTTQLPTTQPPTTQSLTSQPPTTQLSTTQLSTTHLPTTQPPTTQPLITHPLISQPPTSSLTGFQQNIQQTVSFVQTEAAAMSQQAAKEETKAETESATGSPPAKIPKTSSADTTETKNLTPEDMICDGDVCVRRPPKPDEPGPSQAPTPSLGPTTSVPEVTVENAQLEKEKEIERRQAGKGVAELKRWQADQELKQIQEERRREKMENNLARQRILEQIAQDRAERRARDQPQSTQPQQSVQPTASDSGGRARIQFKLPDGSSHTAHFDANGTLREVQRYVADNLRLSTSNFALWTAFPRQELTDADANLRGLQLAPSAALLVLPRRTAAAVARPAAVSSLITFFTQLFTTMILEPSQNLFIWLRTRLFPPPASPPTATRSPSPGPAPPASPTAPGAPGPRRRGNIHRLPSDRAPDDDNNTWNGNSTQQM